MLKIIKIHANDYLILQELSAKKNLSAADLIHGLLTKERPEKSPYTQMIIDVWVNYWAAAHRVKYDFRGKDGPAAKHIGKYLASQVQDPEPEIVGRIFEKILLSLNGTFYYGKELSTISGGINSIVASYRDKNKPGTQGNW